MPSADPDESYERLTDRYEQLVDLGHTSSLLNWDQQVMMPDAGTPARASQLSTLSSIRHDLLTDDEVGKPLEDLEDVSLSGERAAVVREIRRQYERGADVPGDLVEDLSQTQAEAQEVWQDAKAEDDFEHFAPTLERIRDLQVERAEYVDPDAEPYEVMHEDSLPYVTLETVERVFEELRDGLVPLLDEIEASGTEPASPFAGGDYAEADQRVVSDSVLDLLGYDDDRGRLDISPHPFTSGSQFDCRITTRFRPDDPIDGLMATIHEFGHATYQLGLPDEHYGSPLGQSLFSGVHESQSRFWENHVGRTREFWQLFLPELQEQFPELEDVTVDEAYEGVNRVYPDNLIRVEADELTYHLHIVLRFEVGRALVRGDVEVEDVPDVWNDKMEEYLGVRPETDTDGCLQDIHWTGRFAAFQGYTIGSVLAAQLDAAMREDLDDVDGKIRNGEFDPLREWMEQTVHQHGRRYRSDELIERATGEPLTADYFLDYVEEKFGDLYGLT